MAITASLYGGFIQSLAAKEINLGADAFACALLSSSYTPADTHTHWSDVSADEITGTGYTSGGAALTSVTDSYSATTKTLTFTAANVSWPSSTITAAYAVVMDTTAGGGTAANNLLVGYVDFGGNQSDSNGTFEIQWNASGIFTLSHS